MQTINTGAVGKNSMRLRTSNEEKLLFLEGELGALIGDEKTWHAEFAGFAGVPISDNRCNSVSRCCFSPISWYTGEFSSHANCSKIFSSMLISSLTIGRGN